MTKIEQTSQEKQQVYLKRVNQFFTQVKSWLSDDFEIISTENYPVEDETGKYQIPSLSIVKKEPSKPLMRVADLFPKGTSVLIGEGFEDIFHTIRGVGGTETVFMRHLDYLQVEQHRLLATTEFFQES